MLSFGETGGIIRCIVYLSLTGEMFPSLVWVFLFPVDGRAFGSGRIFFNHISLLFMTPSFSPPP